MHTALITHKQPKCSRFSQKNRKETTGNNEEKPPAPRYIACRSAAGRKPTEAYPGHIGRTYEASASRIFFRNSINVGLPVIVCDTDQIDEGDELSVDLETGIVKNETKGIELSFPALPPVMRTILDDGGLLAHIDKNKGFKIS